MPHTPGKRRYIFNTLTVVSVVLMLATLGLWVVGLWFAVSWNFNKYTQNPSGLNFKQYAVESFTGAIQFRTAEIKVVSNKALTMVKSIWPDGMNLDFEEVPFEMRWSFGLSKVGTGTILKIPNWFFALLFSILPVVWFVGRKKRRLAFLGKCPSCGYDLTGNESGECPECGVATKAEATQT